MGRTDWSAIVGMEGVRGRGVVITPGFKALSSLLFCCWAVLWLRSYPANCKALVFGTFTYVQSLYEGSLF